MKSVLKFFVLSSGLSSVFYADHSLAQISAPQLLLANDYQNDIDIQAYWISEKLDGIRAYWTGSELLTRRGKRISAPQWFTQSLPDTAIEGELWAGRGKFALVQNTVLDTVPGDAAWRNIRFMLFDLPGHLEMYRDRYARLRQMVDAIAEPHIRLVSHTQIPSYSWLEEKLAILEKEGAEGLMLRKIDSLYRPGRNNDLIKLKTYQEAEALVIGYKNGKGKYTGQVGSLLARTAEGRVFYIGSGLTDALRKTPPEIGATITYRHNGFTASGLPRFARFMRIREGE